MDSSGDMEGSSNTENVEAQEGQPESAENAEESVEQDESSDNSASDPLYIQKRLKQQKRVHDREMREMQQRMAEMQAQQQMQQQSQQSPNMEGGYYGGQDQQPQQGAGMDETIQRAVGFALQQRDLEERKAKEAEAQAELGKEYQELQRHLDTTSDKYDDFDDVVRGNHAPFTATIRDTALLLPKDGPGSAGEVLYKLGKSPEELNRISKLLPHRQAAEVVKLSHALIRGTDNKPSGQSRPLGTVKSNPATNSAGITEKTSPAQIRALMKEGKFK